MGHRARDSAITSRNEVFSDSVHAVDSLRISHSAWVDAVQVIKSISSNVIEQGHACAESLGLFQFSIDIKQHDGSQKRMVARGHNLGRDGLEFIHGGYLYPGSVCRCLMRHASQGVTPVTGSIAECSHISGMMYLSRVRLDRMIDPGDYLACPPEH